MSSKRWDKDEKARLIHLYSEGKTFSQIAENMGRSDSAIRLRLQTIVYEGIAKGMRAADLADMLKTDVDNIIQMFYTHRDFKESRQEEVVSLEAASKLLFGARKTKTVVKSKPDTKPGELMEDLVNLSTKSVKMSRVQHSSEIDRLMDQNKIMEAIIDNRDLRKKIKKLYKDNKLSEDEKKELEDILQ